MKVKEITVGTARKIGLPGYSSLDVSAFVTVELNEKDAPSEAYDKAWATVEKQVLDYIGKKGLESPVAEEAERNYKGEENLKWLDYESPDQQKAKIKANKKLQQTMDGLKKEKEKLGPSIKPRKGGE